MLQKLKNCFTVEEINTDRQIEFDIAKAICIVVMVISHVMYHSMTLDEEILVRDTLSLFFYLVLSGIFCAPVFMICMGIGISYTKNSTDKDCLIRGGKLLLIAFVLDIFRSFLPIVRDNILADEPLLNDVLFNMTYVDILWFAGLAFLLIGLLKKAKLSSTKIFFVALILGCIATIANHTTINNPILSTVLNYFIYVDERAEFSLFTWFIFPAFGMLIGDLWKRCRDKKTVFAILSPISFILPTVYVCLGFIEKFGPGYSDEYFYGMTVWDTLISLILSVGIFGICYGISRIFKGSKWCITKQLCVNINSIYCIHWVILAWAVEIPFTAEYFIKFTFCSYCLVGIIVTAISAFFACFYKKIKNKFSKKPKLSTRSKFVLSANSKEI